MGIAFALEENEREERRGEGERRGGGERGRGRGGGRERETEKERERELYEECSTVVEFILKPLLLEGGRFELQPFSLTFHHCL